MTPFPTLPGRKLACPRGGLLRNDLRDVAVARSGPSRRQHTCRFAPAFTILEKKFVHFGSAQPGRAQLVRACACCDQNSDFEKSLCQDVRHDLEAFRRFYASETQILREHRRNVFRIGTYLSPKMNIRIGEQGTFQWT
jgi:hypothetical protein